MMEYSLEDAEDLAAPYKRKFSQNEITSSNLTPPLDGIAAAERLIG
jgi:hypothetical protein